MYLINVDTFKLKYFVDLDDPDRPRFAALSHRWGSDEEELTFQEIETPVRSRPESVEKKSGYEKLKEACRAAQTLDLSWIWIDTCCIDMTSSAELQESINSMWRLYSKATLCMVYMNDLTLSYEDDGRKLPAWQVSSQSISEASFEKSQWFTRGWTLQELLAPENVTFHSHTWHAFGTRSSLRDIISNITDIPEQCLDHDKNMGRQEQIRSHSTATIMYWAAARAYSLLGKFDAQMPLLYGEGDKAFHRLQMELLERTTIRHYFSGVLRFVTAWLSLRWNCLPGHLPTLSFR